MWRSTAARGIAVAAIGVGGGWAGLTTLNDEWDDVLPPSRRSPDLPPKKERVVVLGTGWGALEVVRKLSPAQEVVVLSPRPHFTYTPLLAGASVGTVSPQSVVEPIRDFLVKRVQSRFGMLVGNVDNFSAHRTYVQAVCEDVDFERKVIIARPLIDYNVLERDPTQEEIPGKFEVSFDKLVVSVGATTATFNIPGVAEYALFLKEVSDAAAVRQRVLTCLEKASALLSESGVINGGTISEKEAQRLLHFVVVGGGPTGVELSAELADFVRTDVERKFGPRVASKVKITLIEAMPRILGPFDPALGDFAAKHLSEQNVEIRTSMAVQSLTSRTQALVKNIKTGEMETIDFGAIVWAAGIATRPLSLKIAERLGQYTPGARGERPPRGIAVDECLKVKVGEKKGGDGKLPSEKALDNALESVYAIGDCAVSGYAPTAQVAAQQGKYLGRTLRDAYNNSDDVNEDPASTGVVDTPLDNKPFQYNHFGSMAFIGNRSAIAQLPPMQRPAMNFVWRSLHGTPPQDNQPEAQASEASQHVKGGLGFVFWRSVYFSKLLSGTNRVAIAKDWVRTETFGRDVVLTHYPIMPRSYESG